MQKRARAGGSVRQSGLPGIDRGWGGDVVLPKAQGFGFVRCALRRTRQTPEKNGLFGSASGSPESGGDSGSMPSAPRIRALPAADGVRRLWHGASFWARAARAAGLSEKRTLNKKRGQGTARDVSTERAWAENRSFA